jgi:WD40 repeat protein
MITDPMTRILVTAGDDSVVRIWTMPRLDPVTAFGGHREKVTAIAINPQSTVLATACPDLVIRLWSLESGKEISRLSGFATNGVQCLAWSPSGSMLVAAWDGGVVFWASPEAITARPPCRHLPVPGALRVAFSAGGEFLAVVSEPDVLTIFEMKGGQSQVVRNAGRDKPFPLSWLRFGGEARLVTCSFDEGEITVFRPGRGIWERTPVFRIFALKRKISAFAADVDLHFGVVSKGTSAWVVDLVDGTPMGELPSSCHACVVAAAHPTERQIFFLSDGDGQLMLVDIRTRVTLCTIKTPIDVALSDAVWAADGRWLVACDKFGALHQFEVGETPGPLTGGELFDVAQFGGSDGTLCDAHGRPLHDPPHRVGLAALGLRIKLLAHPLLHLSAAELIAATALLATADPPEDVRPRGLERASHIAVTDEAAVNPGAGPCPDVEAMRGVAEPSQEDLLVALGGLAVSGLLN